MARFEYLNANPDGNRENDCVIRAITLVTGLPYEEVEDKLWLTGELLQCDRFCRYCYKHLLEKVFGYNEVDCEGLTVGEFADLHPDGVYLIRIEGHLLPLIHNVVYDTWYNLDYLCDIVWRVE